MIKVYKYRLLPNEDQKDKLIRWMGTARFIYNLALEAKTAAWVSNRVNVSCFDLMKQLTDLRKTPGCEWIKEAPQQSLESAITNLDRAYTAFFKGGGFPRFKKRSERQSLIFRQYGRAKDGEATLTKLGVIKFIEHRKMPDGETRTITVTKTPTGKFFINIMVKTSDKFPCKPQVKEEKTIGIDVGLKHFSTLSDGEKHDNPRLLESQLKRLKKEQRTLSRRFKKGASEQSKNYYKQKMVVAKLHEKITNQRQDFLQKLTTDIIRRYETIVLEDLNIKGMMQNRNLSAKIGDVSWYEFQRILEYKSEWYGKNILYAPRFEPSSKVCSTCGFIKNDMTLTDREWVCLNCGSHHDRDINAAINIKKLGLRTQPSSANVNQ